MKKALIIFAVLFLATLAIPAIAAFTKTPAENANELATLFPAVQIFQLITFLINPLLNFHLFS